MKADEAPKANSGAVPSTIPLLARFIATGGFCGYIPWASGTWGSAAGAAIYYMVPGFERAGVIAAAITVTLVVGAYTASIVARLEGNRLSRTAEVTKDFFQPHHGDVVDPSIVVIDEILGMWVTLAFLPKTFFALCCAFVLFRIFDIVKPFPARQLEHLPRGWGIMLDDVIAGIYANLGTRILLAMASGMFPLTT